MGVDDHFSLFPLAVAPPITPLGNRFMTPSHVELVLPHVRILPHALVVFLFSPSWDDERSRVEGSHPTAAVSLCPTSSRAELLLSPYFLLEPLPALLPGPPRLPMHLLAPFRRHHWCSPCCCRPPHLCFSALRPQCLFGSDLQLLQVLLSVHDSYCHVQRRHHAFEPPPPKGDSGNWLTEDFFIVPSCREGYG